jgi:phosphoglycolate phosphatase
MIKLVIFDLDGTLIDTRQDLANACNHALTQCGFPQRELQEYNMLVGRGIDNLFRGALPDGAESEENVAKMRSIFVPYYNEHSCDYTKPYEGIPELLKTLEQKGLHFAVASNKYQEGTETLVKKYFGNHSFVKILGQRDGKPIKPDPLIVKEAMEGVPGITKEEVVYIGDSNVDMQTGINAEVKTIGVTWGFRSREELEAYSPWKIADHPLQIAEHI